MPVIIGNASRPSFDAAAAMLHNKQIEYQKQIAMAQISAANARAAMGALEGLGKQLLGQANQNAQQDKQIEAQKQRDAMQLAEHQRQQEEANKSAIQKYFDDMESKLKARNEASQQRGFGPHPDVANQMRTINQQMQQIDQKMALGTMPVKEGFQAKIALLRQLATFKYDTPIEDPKQKALDKIIRTAPDGTVLPPGSPPVPGERTWTIDDKNTPHAVTPLPQAKPVDPEVAKQKIHDAMMKAERQMELDRQKIQQSVEKQTNISGFNVFTGDAIAPEVNRRMMQLGDIFERQFGVPSQVITSGMLPPVSARTSGRQTGDDAVLKSLQSHGVTDPTAVEFEQERAKLEQRGVVPPLINESPGIARERTPPLLNGNPIGPLAQYVLGQGVNAGPAEFFQNPLSESYVANALGNKDEAFRAFDRDRLQIIQSVPVSADGQPPPDAKPGSLFFNERHELQQFSTTSTAQPQQGGGGGSGGGSPAGPRPQQQAPAVGRGQMPPMQGGSPSPPQQPQQPQPVRGLREEEIFGHTGNKKADAPDGVESRILLFVTKDNPAGESFINDIIPKMAGNERARLNIVTLDPSDPKSAAVEAKYKVAQGNPTMVREEWNGLGYEITGKTQSLASHGVVAGFMQPIGPAPPGGQPRDLTYVVYNKGTEAEKSWKFDILPRLTADERKSTKAFEILTDAQANKSATSNPLSNTMAKKIADDHNFTAKEGMLLVKGTWNPVAEHYEEQNSATSDVIRNLKQFKEFIRPSHEKAAEETAKIVDENDKASAKESAAEQKRQSAIEEKAAAEQQRLDAERNSLEQAEPNAPLIPPEWAMRKPELSNAPAQPTVPNQISQNAQPVSRQTYTGQDALADFQEMSQRRSSELPIDKARIETLDQRIQQWADNTLAKSQPIGGYDVIGTKPSPEDVEIAKDVKLAGGFPKGTGVMQGLKQIASGRANPVSSNAAQIRLQQRIKKLESEQRKQKEAGLKQTLDRNRIEAEGFTRPTSPMTVPSVPSAQPMRTSQLQQPLSLSQNNIVTSRSGQPMRTSQLQQPLSLSQNERVNFNPMNQQLNAGLGQGVHPDGTWNIPYTAGINTGGGFSTPGFPSGSGAYPVLNQPQYSGISTQQSPYQFVDRGATSYANQPAAYQPGYNVATPWYLPASMGFAGGSSYQSPSSYGDYYGNGYESLDFSIPQQPEYFPPYFGDPFYSNPSQGFYPAGDYSQYLSPFG